LDGQGGIERVWHTFWPGYMYVSFPSDRLWFKFFHSTFHRKSPDTVWIRLVLVNNCISSPHGQFQAWRLRIAETPVTILYPGTNSLHRRMPRE
jgi:hypothetical protein